MRFLAAGAATLAAAALTGLPATAGASRAELGSALQDLVATDAAGGSVPARADEAQLAVTPGERVLIDVYVTGDVTAAASRLRAAGMEVRATTDGPPSAFVEGLVPVDRIVAISDVPGVAGVQPVQGFGTDVGAQTSAGDAAHRGPQARALGATGAGVKVGVISDSIDQVGTKLAGSQATGDLPTGVDVLKDDTIDVSDEGRAMAEIIYDTAPGLTQMAFASGTAAGAADKADSIDALVAAGARIIADDIFYLGEPFFQDGVVSRAVDRARAAGVLYLASAGNRARQSYESAPRFPAGNGVLHDFDPGAGTDTVQTVATVASGGRLLISLQWDEPWGQATRDIDALLVRPDGTALPGAAPSGGTNDNLAAPRNPSEIVAWTNTTADPVAVGLQIRRFAGAASTTPLTTLKYIANGSVGDFAAGEHVTSSDAINPDAAAAAGSLAVAAVNAADEGLDDPEGFSSRGPKTRLFDVAGNRLATPEVRQKPELAAADGVATTVPGFNPFFGTSAATPSAAGVAALALSAKPGLPLAVLRAIMTAPANTIACSATLPDPDCGFGFLLADRAVAQAQDPSPPVVSQTVTPSAPTGANGWWTTDVSATWSFTDPGSPALPTGCGASARTTDGVQASPDCSVVSAGGTTTRQGVTLRRDTTPPAPPVITGIDPQAFVAGAVPSSVGCRSSDATSGLASCTVTPVDQGIGAHTLTAVATDVAGLTSTSTLDYVVVPPAPAPVATAPPVPAIVPVSTVSAPAASQTTKKTTAKRVVVFPSSRRCFSRRKTLRIRIRKPANDAIRSVSVKVSGLKQARTRTRHGTMTLGRLRRKKTTVTVTIRFRSGHTSKVRRTYRRC